MQRAAQGGVPQGAIDWSPYVASLADACPDLDGRRLPAGTQVLRNTVAPSEVLRDTPENRADFERRGFAWTEGARQRSWFGAQMEPSTEWQGRADAVAHHAHAFIDRIGLNIMGEKDGAQRASFPSVCEPWWFRWLPWEPKVRSVERVAELSSQVLDAFASAAGLPPSVSLPQAWQARLRLLNRVFIYRVSGMGSAVDVVAAFVSPFTAGPGGTVELREPGAADRDVVEQAYAGWARSSGRTKARFVFYTLASHRGWAAGVAPSSSESACYSYSWPKPGGGWDHPPPQRYTDRISLANFIGRLRPESRDERVVRIKEFVDQELEMPGAIVHVDKVRDHFRYRRTEVREAFGDLQERSGYGIYKTKGMPMVDDGLIAIRRPQDLPAAGQAAISLRPASSGRKVVVRVVVGVVTMAIPPLLARLLPQASERSYTGLALSVVLAYAGQMAIKFRDACVQGRD